MNATFTKKAVLSFGVFASMMLLSACQSTAKRASERGEQHWMSAKLSEADFELIREQYLHPEWDEDGSDG